MWSSARSARRGRVAAAAILRRTRVPYFVQQALLTPTIFVDLRPQLGVNTFGHLKRFDVRDFSAPSSLPTQGQAVTPMTTAEKVRRLYAAGVTDTAELMRRANTSRQAVHAALQRTGKRGRPPRNLSQMTIAVPVDTSLWIQEQANRADCSLGDVVHSAIAAVRSRRARVSKPEGSGG